MKKTLGVILVTLLALMVTGCNNASGISTTPAPTKPVATTPVQTTPAPTTPPTTPAPTEPTTAEPVDELEVLRVPESYAKSEGGIYLKRKGGLYTIRAVSNGRYGCTRSVPRVVGREYNVGDGGEYVVTLYAYITTKYNYVDVPFGYLSYGEVPVPIVEKGDLIIGYFSEEPFTLTLQKLEFHGYTLPVLLGDYGKVGSEKYGPDGVSNILRGKDSDFTIVDNTGGKPSDVRNLEYGKEYTVSWYSGTQYNEEKMIANCSYYTYPNRDERITLNGELTKNGYVTFDTSSLSPGFYEALNGIVIKIE